MKRSQLAREWPRGTRFRDLFNEEHEVDAWGHDGDRWYLVEFGIDIPDVWRAVETVQRIND